MTDSTVRALLTADRVTHVPGVWDPASAALAVRAGHRAVLLSGAAVSATMLGRPDLGLVPATQIADRAAGLRAALGGVPLLADGDTGYDDPRYAVWTALAYQRAGISGIVIGDLRDPGMSSVELARESQAVARLVALAREVPGMTVIARTDAFRGWSSGGSLDGSGGSARDGSGATSSDGTSRDGSGGSSGGGSREAALRAAIGRCRAYAAAGADAVLPWGVEDAASLFQMRAALPGVRLVASRTEATTSPPPATDADLAGLGIRLVLHPMSALLAALRAASLVYRSLAVSGDVTAVDRMPWATFEELSSPPPPGDAPSAGVPSAVSASASGRSGGPSAGRSADAARLMERIDRLDT